MFNASQAVDYFHKALGIRRDDTFSTTMLDQALEMMLADLGKRSQRPVSTLIQNNQETGRRHWATLSSFRSFAPTARSFTHS